MRCLFFFFSVQPVGVAMTALPIVYVSHVTTVWCRPRIVDTTDMKCLSMIFLAQIVWAAEDDCRTHSINRISAMRWIWPALSYIVLVRVSLATRMSVFTGARSRAGRTSRHSCGGLDIPPERHHLCGQYMRPLMARSGIDPFGIRHEPKTHERQGQKPYPQSLSKNDDGRNRDAKRTHALTCLFIGYRF